MFRVQRSTKFILKTCENYLRDTDTKNYDVEENKNTVINNSYSSITMSLIYNYLMKSLIVYIKLRTSCDKNWK